MPARHPPYPYVETTVSPASALEIEILADRNAHDWGYRAGKSLDETCKAAGLDIEYSHYPNEILLEVPLDGRPVIWLPRKGRKRDDRVLVATALGHWSLHIDVTRKAHPSCGVQALYDTENEASRMQASSFGLALLMPKDAFLQAWSAGRSQAAADQFDVPTKFAYLRAEDLEIGEAV